LKVYLLIADDGTRLFYSEAPERPDTAQLPTRAGFRGWLERKGRKVKTAWQHADRGFAGQLRRGWDWLARRTPPDEPMLVRLRTAADVEIHHPASLGVEEVRGEWTNYLASRKRRHLPRFGINVLIAPLTVVLAPLPGPNLVGYWFAYRAWRHLGALRGLRRAGRERIALSFHPIEVLDRPIGPRAESLTGLERQGLKLAGVADFLRRSRPRAGVATRSGTFPLAAIRPTD